MLDRDSAAAKRFYKMVRDFSINVRPWETAVFYETKPDEVHDITLVSRRVYGRPDEFLAVMAAAGLDSADKPLRQKRIALPTESQLYSIKRAAGFESMSELRRQDGSPTWSED